MNWQHFEKLESYIPFDLSQTRYAVVAFLVILAIVLIRYFVMVLPFLLLFYSKWGKTFFAQRFLYAKIPSGTQQLQEIKWSMISAVIFASFGLLLGWLWQRGDTQIFLKMDSVSPFYFWFAAPVLLVILHDTYFYWTHRWLHRPRIFKLFHEVHHRSLTPSPWASFAFHPGESMVNAAAVPLICLILPLHPLHILVHLSLMTLSAISNHLGYEILPTFTRRFQIGKWVISGAHHSQHHRFFRTNYGLFFSFWDRGMETENVNTSSRNNSP